MTLDLYLLIAQHPLVAAFLVKRQMNHYQDDIYLYKFPQNMQVEGPAQISALMNQNPEANQALG
jgi:uncharacterized membrane protein (UPF0182 family)